jgi:hypothetical protein
LWRARRNESAKLPLTMITMIASCKTRICVDSLRDERRFVAHSTNEEA